MITLDQIAAAHSKVKSGADFPSYIREIKALGVSYYDAFVADGHTVYTAVNGQTVSSQPKYAPLHIQQEVNTQQFVNDLKAHQQGQTTYPTFCSDCAKSGIHKWVVNLQTMTCTYFDSIGNQVLVEPIPL